MLVTPELVFLEADDDVLIRRYGLTRRSHPLHEPTLLGDLFEEHRVLEGIRSHAEALKQDTVTFVYFLGGPNLHKVESAQQIKHKRSFCIFYINDIFHNAYDLADQIYRITHF